MLALSSTPIVSGSNIGIAVHETFIFEVIGFIIFLFLLSLIYWKTKKRVLFVIILITIVAGVFFTFYPFVSSIFMQDPDDTQPPETIILEIVKLTHEPRVYSILNESELENNRLRNLKKILAEMEEKKIKRIGFELPRDEGFAISNYLIHKQVEPCCTPYHAQFKYKEEFYGLEIKSN